MKKIILIISVLFLSCSSFSQQKRLALVMGNSNYEFEQLSYPKNNTTDIAQKLSDLGFQVLTYYNLDQVSLKEVIDKFGSELHSYDVGLVYYTGVASQAKGDNYIVPVDANPETENDVEYTCVNVGRILGKMEDAGVKTKLLIFDASSDNKFERNWNFKTGVRGRGLAFMNAPVGSLIAYSTSPGRITPDENQRNSIYTQTLLNYIDEPNLSIEDMFKKVRIDVKESSQNKQIPWESTSLESNFYFSIDENFNEILITDINTKEEEQTTQREIKNIFTDKRDGQEYAWIKAGNQVWMAQNLNYEIEEYSWCYDNIERNCKTNGRLYNYEAAKQACPDGWHLPSDEEWKMLEIHIGMSRTHADMRGIERGTIQGGKLKAVSDLWEIPNNGATDEIQFSAIPSGYRDDAGVYAALSKWAFYWSSTEQTNMCAWSRIFLHDRTIIERFNMLTKFGQSVRCVKD